jgi:LysM repeat protein
MNKKENRPMTRTHTRIARSFGNLCGNAVLLRRWLIGGALLLVFWLGLTLIAAPRSGSAKRMPTAIAPSTYVVQPGDSWTSVSRKTGLSIRELQAANPQSVPAAG